ncbi:MAG: hypothetical protein V1912_11365 [bacterium]
MTVNDGHLGPSERFHGVDELLDDHEMRLRRLETWQTEIRTVLSLLRWTFGASVLAVLIGLLNLVDMLAKH